MTFRRRRATIAPALLLLCLMVGCHAYEPIGRTEPTDTRVRVSFTKSRPVLIRFADGDSTTRSLHSFKGLITGFDGDSIRLHDLRIPGGSPDSAIVTAAQWQGSTVTVATVDSKLEVVHLQKGRTALALTGGFLAGLLLFLAAAMSSFGS